MAEENQKVAEGQQKIIEKYYIEVSSSFSHRFIAGLVGGLGWGIGITIGTALFIGLMVFLVSKLNPELGKTLTDFIKEAQKSSGGLR